MSRTIRWLKADLARVRVGERALAIKRVHLSTLILAVIIGVIVGLIVGGAAGRYVYPYRTVPRPALPPGESAPKPDCPHVMGGCLPAPAGAVSSTQTVALRVALARSLTGPDFSNNNPVLSRAAWQAIGARNSFAVFKVIEGTGFVDRTAAAMGALARAHRLAGGGYDFLHVCLVSASAEAHLYAVELRAKGLLGAGTLPPTGDAEWPLGPLGCNGRAWIAAWAAEVKRETGRTATIYTGAWWWNPHIGAWWPSGALAWVSGYTGSLGSVPRPAGRPHIDLWQNSDREFNGASTADFSIWLDGRAAFERATGAPAAPIPALSRAVYRFHSQHASERNTVRTWDRARCRNPVRRAVCRSSRAHLILLADRDYFVAHHHLVDASISALVRRVWVPIARPRWGQSFLGWRYRQLTLRIGRRTR